MGIFSRKNRTQTTANIPATDSPNARPVPDRPRILSRAPFVYDANLQPAVSLKKVEQAAQSAQTLPQSGVSLIKGYQTANKLFADENLTGVRIQVIALVDGSGSMKREYTRPDRNTPSMVEKMLIRALGFGLTIDEDGSIPVIVYGNTVSDPVDIDLNNYENVGDRLAPDFWSTNMAGALQTAVDMAVESGKLTLIINITDGDPSNPQATKKVLYQSAGHPIMVKNLAIKSVPFLKEVDDELSKYKIRRDPDGKPLKDANGRLVIDIFPDAPRLVDNVDSQAIDPYSASEEAFIKAMVEEISDCLEVMGRVGILTDVPGHAQEYELS